MPIGLPFNDRRANVRQCVLLDTIDPAAPTSLTTMAGNPAPVGLAPQPGTESQPNRVDRIIANAAPGGLFDNDVFDQTPPVLDLGEFELRHGAGQREDLRPHLNVPTWLNTTAAVDGLIGDCFRLTARLHELGRQRVAARHMPRRRGWRGAVSRPSSRQALVLGMPPA